MAIFSIPGPEQTRAVCSLLESFLKYRTGQGYPPRDPTMRIVLIAEQRAVAIERWHEIGVHEFIIAPILPRALAFKVGRHQQRASASHVPDPVRELHERTISPSSEEARPAPRRTSRNYRSSIPSFNRCSKSPMSPIIERMSAFPDDGAEPPQKISVVASIPELKEEEGEWRAGPHQEEHHKTATGLGTGLGSPRRTAR